MNDAVRATDDAESQATPEDLEASDEAKNDVSRMVPSTNYDDTLSEVIDASYVAPDDELCDGGGPSAQVSGGRIEAGACFGEAGDPEEFEQSGDPYVGANMSFACLVPRPRLRIAAKLWRYEVTFDGEKLHGSNRVVRTKIRARNFRNAQNGAGFSFTIRYLCKNRKVPRQYWTTGRFSASWEGGGRFVHRARSLTETLDCH